MEGSQKILILGTGRYAPVLAEIISEIPGLETAGFVENQDRQRCGGTLLGLPVYWIDEAGALAGDHLAVCSLATTRRTEFIRQAEEAGFAFATIIHPSCRIPASASVGVGCVLEPGVILSTHARIGRHVRINRGATIGHDTEIEDYVTIQPGVHIAGLCRIGSCAYIGIGAVVLDQMTIGRGSLVGAGAIVTRPVADRVLVLGMPAKVVRENIDAK